MKKIPLETFSFVHFLRQYFTQKGYKDILAPILVPHPGIDLHVHPLQVRPTLQHSANNRAYLHTSPEFYMKNLLAQHPELEQVFTLNYAFRDDITSPIHRNQFILLEWYQTHKSMEQMLQETKELIYDSYEWNIEGAGKGRRKYENLQTLQIQDVKMDELFQEHIHRSILDFDDFSDLYHLLQKDFPSIPLPQNTSRLSWDDLFFLLFLNEINPHVEKYPAIAITHWPKRLAALAKLDPLDPRVAKRFEIYLRGVEICNCFEELVDFEEQVSRAKESDEEKKKFYDYQLGEPEILLSALKQGLPPSSGNALGVERLFYSLWETQDFFVS